MEFKLNRLTSYENEDLLEEVKRVASLVGKIKLTTMDFKKYGRVDLGTLRSRFGSWEETLIAAKLQHLFNNKNQKLTKNELIEKLQQIAINNNLKTVSARQFEKYGSCSTGPYIKEFSSWSSALKVAGLKISSSGKRYTVQDCYENLLEVWTCYGRPPTYNEMANSPSNVGGKAYINRWGTWNKALHAFVNSTEENSPKITVDVKIEISHEDKPKRDKRDIPLGLRYKVLSRDHFKCKICGRSPATELGVKLHVDHIHPWSKGGATSLENLRTLCLECNLGKSDKIETKI